MLKRAVKGILFLLLGIALSSLLCAAASADSGSAIWPEYSSSNNGSGKLRLDTSGVKDGYFFAAITNKTSHRMKLRVIKDDTTLTYDLNTNGDFELFPLQLGDGYYEIVLYENVSGKKYSQEGKVGFSVKLNRPDAAFLVPSQYLNYTKKSEVVAMADSLGSGKSEKETFDAVCKFMSSSFVYDFIKAVTVKPGMLPDIDGSYAKKMGVCQDLSAIMVAMLRTQGIPSRLIIGYADNQYHAWTMTSVNGSDAFFDPTAALSAISTVKEYSMERYY